MTSTNTLSVDELIDGQKIRLLNLQILVLSFFAMMIDGYDLFAAPFSAPYIIKAWNVDKADFAPVFSASLFGIMVGAAALGWLGDRRGRRSAIVAGLCICGIFSALTAYATNVNDLWLFRFATGIGLGGVMPNAISLNAEMAPKRARAMLIVLMFAGINVGGAIPGLVSAWWVPDHGWQLIYWIGGVAPICVAVALRILMPESLKFLTIQPGRQNAALRLARRIRPDLTIPHDAQFAIDVGGEAGAGSDRSSITNLFSAGFAKVTMLLWALFALNLMTSYLLTSWMPILLQSNSIGPQQAALANAMYQIGGVAGGILVSLLLNRYGMHIVAVLFLLAVPAVAAIGIPNSNPSIIVVVVMIAGFCNMGLQFGLNASAGLLYPTSIRSKGVGMAFSVGRIGSIVGPFAGAMLIRSGVNLTTLFALAAVPLAVGSIAALALARLCVRRAVGSFGTGEGDADLLWAYKSH